LPGSWNVALIQQTDGIVILESPISSAYSAEVIAEARRRYPGQPIKGVITTSDSWPHIAGIRQYAAEGIPIYALDLNHPILQRFLAAPYTSKPDLLARAPRTAQFHLVGDKTEVGTGTNRIEIYPLRGETSERQMMVYLPGLHLLYGSDPFQQMPDGSYHVPQTVTELMGAVNRNHLSVSRFWMMHVGLTPWIDLTKAVATAEERNTPDGTLQ
jgi:flavorubredoxin